MSNIIQVTNIASTVTEDNIKTLFGFVGGIREMIIYFESSQSEETKVAYVVFESNNDAETSLHLHNTVFHDRALIVLPLAESCKGQIPDISYAKMIRAPEKTVTGITPKSKNWPADVISMVVGRTGEQSIHTIEPNFEKQGLPNYPKLPYSTEVAKIDEIRRTILVTNLNAGTSSQQVLDFFQPVAEVKFIRMAGSEHDNAVYVEFTDQGAVSQAFGMMGSDLNGRAIMIQHSNVAISKASSGSTRTGITDEASGARRARGSRSRSRSRHGKPRRRSRSRKRSASPRARKTSKTRRRSRSRHADVAPGTKSRSHRRSRSRSARHSRKGEGERHKRTERSRSKGEKRSKRDAEKSPKVKKERQDKGERRHRHHRDEKKDKAVTNGSEKVDSGEHCIKKEIDV